MIRTVLISLILAPALMAADGPAVGQPTIFWRNNRWETFNGNRWVPINQSRPNRSSNLLRPGDLPPSMIPIGAPMIALGQSNAKIGPPMGGMGESTVPIGPPMIAIGPPNGAIGPSATALGQSSAKIGPPMGGMGQSTVPIGTPMIALGKSTIGIGQPVMQTGPLPVGVHAPTVKPFVVTPPSSHPRAETHQHPNDPNRLNP